ncbi:MAG: 3-deoxy-manno-octulosonate cytidylyltransferase [Alphaproteobacteria bacterium]|nr:3-deoxy-manno-octulosonate cytidylyltransferase [Alphaproteobacteria bacterium]
MNPIILIPARLASTRLPGKPLALLRGVPMIVWVWRYARESGLGRVAVACAEREIAEVIRAEGGEAVLTDPAHPSGSDRIFEALQTLDPERRHDAVVNLQGDNPLLPRDRIEKVRKLLEDPVVDIGTLAAVITDDAEARNPNVVKAVVSVPPGADHGRALYFTRATAPSGEGPLYHHLGIYSYRRAALERFVRLPPSPLEQRERLEQLRALEAGMHIEVGFVDSASRDINTPADLEWAERHLAESAP